MTNPTPTRLSLDDRLDAIAMVRACISGDEMAMRAIADANARGALLGILRLITTIITMNVPDSDAYLDGLAAEARAQHEGDER